MKVKIKTKEQLIKEGSLNSSGDLIYGEWKVTEIMAQVLGKEVETAPGLGKTFTTHIEGYNFYFPNCVVQGQEEFEALRELELEGQVALVEVYFADIISKLSSKQKVECCKLILQNFDHTNPLINKLTLSEINAEYYSSTLPTSAINFNPTGFNPENCYTLRAKVADRPLQFCLLLKDLTGVGLKKAKDATNGLPGEFLYNMSKQEVLKAKKEFEEKGFKVQIGIINYK